MTVKGLVLAPAGWVSDGPLNFVEKKEPQGRRAANCIRCGRFCKWSQHEYYDGQWNQIKLTTYCAQCGEMEMDLV